MKKPAIDPNKVFMTEFMIVAILANNVSLSETDICAIINRVLSEKLVRSESRIVRNIKNLLERGIIEETEFGNYCLNIEHRSMLKA